MNKTDIELFGTPVLGGTSLDLPEKVPGVPESNQDYVFRTDTLRVVLDYIFNGSRLKNGMFLFGPSGTGKTSVIEQVCARLHVPVQAQVGSDELSWADMVGQFVFTQPGKMEWVYGPLSIAYKYGQVYLIDELDRMSIPAPFYRILEKKDLTLPNGETIKMHPDFRLFATGNTNGAGDASGKYAGTVVQNEALMQRFKVLEVYFPDHDVEVNVILKFMNVVGIPDVVAEDYAKAMVKAAGIIRSQQEAAENGDPTASPIFIDFSTRTILSWVEEWANFNGINGILRKENTDACFYGLDRAVLARADSPTKEAIRQILSDVGLKPRV